MLGCFFSHPRKIVKFVLFLRGPPILILSTISNFPGDYPLFRGNEHITDHLGYSPGNSTGSISPKTVCLSLCSENFTVQRHPKHCCAMILVQNKTFILFHPKSYGISTIWPILPAAVLVFSSFSTLLARHLKDVVIKLSLL